MQPHSAPQTAWTPSEREGEMMVKGPEGPRRRSTLGRTAASMALKP